MEAFQKRQDMMKMIQEEKSKAMSALRVRKLLLRKVSLKFGEKGSSELLKKLVDMAIQQNKSMAKEEAKEKPRELR